MLKIDDGRSGLRTVETVGFDSADAERAERALQSEHISPTHQGTLEGQISAEVRHGFRP